MLLGLVTNEHRGSIVARIIRTLPFAVLHLRGVDPEHMVLMERRPGELDFRLSKILGWDLRIGNQELELHIMDLYVLFHKLSSQTHQTTLHFALSQVYYGRLLSMSKISDFNIILCLYT